MSYIATFRNRAERELVNMACRLTGLSQAAYTRAVLIKDALALLERARNESAKEVPTAATGGASAGADAGGDVVATATDVPADQGASEASSPSGGV